MCNFTIVTVSAPRRDKGEVRRGCPPYTGGSAPSAETPFQPFTCLLSALLGRFTEKKQVKGRIKRWITWLMAAR